MRKKLKSILKIYPLLLLVMIFVAAKAGMSMASSSTTLRNAYQKMYKPGKVEGVVGSINFMGDFDVNGGYGVYHRVVLATLNLPSSPARFIELGWIKANYANLPPVGLLYPWNYYVLLVYGQAGTPGQPQPVNERAILIRDAIPHTFEIKHVGQKHEIYIDGEFWRNVWFNKSQITVADYVAAGGEAIGEYPGMYLKVCSLGCSYLGTSIFDLKWIKKNPNGNLVKKPWDYFQTGSKQDPYYNTALLDNANGNIIYNAFFDCGPNIDFEFVMFCNGNIILNDTYGLPTED